VVLLVERVPIIGMLMIPKTVAYVVIAWLGYRGVFRQTSLAFSETLEASV
jgi:hypothetical protein